MPYAFGNLSRITSGRKYRKQARIKLKPRLTKEQSEALLKELIS